jgi:pimeloyl-ACP methyl ester carboxylesterase
MHGKGGSPVSPTIAPFAAALERAGVRVANLDMPWSGARNYDVDTAAAEKEVLSALDALRAKGATHLFVVGHSQGGAFALHMGGRAKLDGVVAISPGGSSSSRVVREKLGGTLEEARRHVAQGKGAERQRLADFEGSRGMYPVAAVPAAYVTWFDPEGAMSQDRAMRAVNRDVPVLYVVPTRDYAPLVALKDRMFGLLPKNPRTRLYEPDADHMDALQSAQEEIVAWMRQAR